jgi:GTP1/Obg family GTP-binding protein
MRRKLGAPIIVVSGLPRSGTSMMMKMLNAAELEIVTDEIRTADEDNPKGYFELEKVKELDKGGDKSWVAEHRGKVLKVISSLLKDLPDDCRYKVILMRRDLNEVIASQNKMLVRRGEKADGEDDDKMIALYTTHLRKLELLLRESPNFECLEIHYRQVVETPREQAQRVADFIGRGDRAEVMADAVDRQLYRNRK